MPKKSRSRGQAMPSRSPVLQSFFDGYNASAVDRSSALARASAIARSSNVARSSAIARASSPISLASAPRMSVERIKPVSTLRLKQLLNRLKRGSRSRSHSRNRL